MIQPIKIVRTNEQLNEVRDPPIALDGPAELERITIEQLNEVRDPPIALDGPAETPAETPTEDMRLPTPLEVLADLERITGAPIADEVRARFLEAQPYKGNDLAKLHFSGEIFLAPQGLRLLLCSIDSNDASPLGLAGAIKGVAQEHDSRRCIAHRVLAVGDGVQHYLDAAGWPDDTREPRSVWRRLRAWLSGRGARERARPMVGDHIFALSTVTDRASKTDHACRVWTVHVDDMSMRWPMTG